MRTRTLAIKPGLKWKGKLSVDSREGGHCYAVSFDAEIVNAPEGSARYVYDRAVLSRQQVIDWTGVDPEA